MLDGLKRTLRPARPLLLPIWRPIRPFVEGDMAPWAVTARRERALRRMEARFDERAEDGPATIRPLRKQEFDELAAREPYYRGRWSYLSTAAAEAGRLILRYDLRTALELGPYLRPLVVGADVMDVRRHADLVCEGSVVLHDAREAPWPIETRAYGLFVGLQVFEHLGTSQAEAFREVRRVASHAILSLPIGWQMDDPKNVHHMLTNERALSWFAPVVPSRILVGTPGRRKRLVYVFENLPLPDSEGQETEGKRAG